MGKEDEGGLVGGVMMVHQLVEDKWRTCWAWIGVGATDRTVDECRVNDE